MQDMTQRESPFRRAVRRPDERPTDAVLIGRMTESDVAALEAVYARYSPRVYALCLRMMRNREHAEEVLQDTFWQLWKRPERFDPERGSLATFLFQIARSRCLDRLRFEQRRGTRSTIGDEKARNPALTAESFEAFRSLR